MFGRNCCPRSCCNRMPMQCCQPQECPVVEPAINKCIEREFCHEVPQG